MLYANRLHNFTQLNWIVNNFYSKHMHLQKKKKKKNALIIITITVRSMSIVMCMIWENVGLLVKRYTCGTVFLLEMWSCVYHMLKRIIRTDSRNIEQREEPSIQWNTSITAFRIMNVTLIVYLSSRREGAQLAEQPGSDVMSWGGEKNSQEHVMHGGAHRLIVNACQSNTFYLWVICLRNTGV